MLIIINVPAFRQPKDSGKDWYKEKTMPTSKLYQKAITTRLFLKEQINEIENYLTTGEAKSEVFYYDKRNKLISSRQKNSQWNTSIGKSRVETSHKNFVSANTYLLPEGTAKVKVKSPFVNSGTQIQRGICSTSVVCEMVVT